MLRSKDDGFPSNDDNHHIPLMQSNTLAPQATCTSMLIVERLLRATPGSFESSIQSCIRSIVCHCFNPTCSLYSTTRAYYHYSPATIAEKCKEIPSCIHFNSSRPDSSQTAVRSILVTYSLFAKCPNVNRTRYTTYFSVRGRVSINTLLLHIDTRPRPDAPPTNCSIQAGPK